MGPVQIRLTGVVKVDEHDKEVPSLDAPSVTEATALLHRSARVNGADAVIAIGADYRRLTIARGPLSTETIIEVQAWGTAVTEPEVVVDLPKSLEEQTNAA